MSTPKVYKWPIPDTQGFCLTQTLGAAGSLLINGTLTVNSMFPGEAFTPGISRTVSLTSGNDLHLVHFTITGFLGGSVVSETRVGPNVNTVETTQLFDKVTSVTTDAAAAAVSVGTGTTGVTHWFNYDYHRSYPILAAQGTITGTINYTLDATLDDVQTNASPTLFTPSTDLTAATTTKQATLIGPYTYLKFTINSSDATGALVATLLQAGIL